MGLYLRGLYTGASNLLNLGSCSKKNDKIKFSKKQHLLKYVSRFKVRYKKYNWQQKKKNLHENLALNTGVKQKIPSY